MDARASILQYMKNPEFKTKFWRNAAASLPENVRARYMHDLEGAERMELALDGAIELVSRARSAFGRTFHTPVRT
jgi:hypothetical protein